MNFGNFLGISIPPRNKKKDKRTRKTLQTTFKKQKCLNENILPKYSSILAN